MDAQDNAQAGPGQSRPKRHYEPPRIESETIFETTALACGKRAGQNANCNRHPQNS